MNNLKLEQVLLFVVFISLTSSSAQSLVIDKSFGNKGRIELDAGHRSQLHYDLHDQHIYLTYNKNERDGFSYQYIYLKNGVYKINKETGKLDSEFGKKGHYKESTNSHVDLNQQAYWIDNQDVLISTSLLARSSNFIQHLKTTPTTDLLILDKKTGKTSSFPKSKKFKKDPTGFLLHYDKNLHSIVSVSAKSLVIYNEILGSDKLELKDYGINNSPRAYRVHAKADSLAILINPITSAGIEEPDTMYLFTLVKHQFDAVKMLILPPNTQYYKWDNERSALITYSKDSIGILQNFPHNISNWSYHAAVLHDTDQLVKCLDLIDNSLYYLIRENKVIDWSMELGSKNIMERIPSAHSIMKMDLDDGSTKTYNLLDLFPKETDIQEVQFIEHNSLIVKIRGQKRKKNYLYKVMMRD